MFPKIGARQEKIDVNVILIIMNVYRMYRLDFLEASSLKLGSNLKLFSGTWWFNPSIDQVYICNKTVLIPRNLLSRVKLLYYFPITSPVMPTNIRLGGEIQSYCNS